MGERLSTEQSWRPQRRAPIDPQLMRMALIAGGVAVLGALGVGGYTLMASRPHTVPVIEADSRPLRVRPDNPGGMQVAGADEQIMGGDDSGQDAAMAPPPEAPQMAALRAQIDAARQPAPPAQAAPPAQPLPPPAPTPLAAAAAPEPPPALTLQPAAHAAAGSGGAQVQLAAVETQQAAMSEWQRLAKKMPDLLSSRHPAVVRAQRDGKLLWRLRTGGFADIAQATQFCAKVRAEGGGCTLANF